MFPRQLHRWIACLYILATITPHAIAASSPRTPRARQSVHPSTTETCPPVSVDPLGSGPVTVEWLESVLKGAQPTIQLAEGGGISGRGGEGIACFASSELAAHSVDSEGRLLPEGRAHIQRVVMLDYWEQELNIGTMGEGIDLSMPLSSEDSRSYLQRITNDHLAPAIPFFGEQFTRALTQIEASERPLQVDTATQLPKQGLPRLRDGGQPRRPILPECRVVQIAVRFAIKQDGGRPDKVYTFIDQDLRARMRQARHEGRGWNVGALNEAILNAHEAVYLLAVRMGATTSETSRQALAGLFSRQIYFASGNIGWEYVASPAFRHRIYMEILRGSGFEGYANIAVSSAAVQGETPEAARLRSLRADYATFSVLEAQAVPRALQSLPERDQRQLENGNLFQVERDRQGPVARLNQAVIENLGRNANLTPGQAFIAAALTPLSGKDTSTGPNLLTSVESLLMEHSPRPGPGGSMPFRYNLALFCGRIASSRDQAEGGVRTVLNRAHEYCLNNQSFLPYLQ